MAITGTIRAQGLLTGLLTGQAQVDLAWDITAGSPLSQFFSLPADTPVAITIPSTCRLVILRPPLNNVIAWQLIATDGSTVAKNLDPTFPNLLTNAGDTAVYLKAIATTMTNCELRCF